MSEIPKDWKVWQNAQVVASFTDDRRGALLGAREQLEILQQLLPPISEGANRPQRVLDIGCGDGILMATVLLQWPQAQGVGVDGSEAMLERARQRFAGNENIVLRHVDFNFPEWREALPVRSFDAVVSGFAIHHSEDDRKRSLYAEIFDLLAPGGVFVNVEHVASASPLGEEMFERAFAHKLASWRREKGEDVTFEMVLNENKNRIDKAANRLSPVETQLAWLRDIGYVDVDCYWKHYELAILAGYKSA